MITMKFIRCPRYRMPKQRDVFEKSFSSLNEMAKWFASTWPNVYVFSYKTLTKDEKHAFIQKVNSLRAKKRETRV